MIFQRTVSRSVEETNVSERLAQVRTRAKEEARRLRHGYVGTEHALLALVRDRGGIVADVLRGLGVDPDRVRVEVEGAVETGRSTRTASFPITPRMRTVVELARIEAREMGHACLGTEHLLLGLIREEKGIAAVVLARLGVTLEAARREVARLLGTELDEADRGTVEPPAAFDVEIDDASPQSIYEQVVAQVQEAVATRRLEPGERLPTVRQLADRLDVAPGTVMRAYAELERRGVVVTEGARGTRVAPRQEPGSLAGAERLETLAGLLRPVAVAAFHLGATAAELRDALERAMGGIFGAGTEGTGDPPEPA